MEALKCIEARRSVRSFTDKQIDRDTIEKLVKYAQLAPSWKNSQTTRFTAIADKAVLSEVCAALGDWNQKIVSGAPLLMAVSAVTGRSGYASKGVPESVYGEGYTFFDCGAAVENFCLAATDLGIGTVILGIFDAQKLKELAKIPDGEDVIVLIACGCPEGVTPAPKRREPLEVLRFIE